MGFPRTVSLARYVPGLNLARARLKAGSGLDYDPSTHCRLFEDFFLDAGATLPVPWGKQDTSAAGTPTIDYVADAANGEYKLLTDSGTSEVENITLYWADQLVVDITKKPILECRFKFDKDSALAATDKFVIGMASARNPALDSVTDNAWFRFEGANSKILIESDDGTTDRDDVDSTLTWTDDSYMTILIDYADTSNVRFFVKRAGDTAFVPCNTSTTMSVAASTAKLQFFCELQRAANTKAHAVTIDYVDVIWNR